MQDHPAPTRILDLAVAHLRERALPQLQGKDQFEMRVVIAALQLVAREVALAPASDSAERARLETLLRESADLASLNRRLCEEIRDGRMDLGTPGLAQHLRQTALAKLAVDQPTYSAYRRAAEE